MASSAIAELNDGSPNSKLVERHHQTERIFTPLIINAIPQRGSVIFIVRVEPGRLFDKGVNRCPLPRS